jgi:NAD(P)-dependent dehydrogenase (short-subunit alcohol dehydrogenase family)
MIGPDQNNSATKNAGRVIVATKDFQKGAKEMSYGLEGKSAVVTGSGNGVGRAVALNFAAEGVKIVVNDIATEADGVKAADKVVAEIVNAGGIAVPNYDSVATMQGGKNIIDTAVKNFGTIDILVNCAGNYKSCPTIEMTEGDWSSVIDVHLRGHFNCCKAAVMEMLKQKRGRIINISSRAAAIGAGSAAYSAAKAGILGLTSMMSEEFLHHGITVNAILPTAETKLFPGKRLPGPDNLPVASSIDPDFIAPIILYLATDDAQCITGRYMFASGGDVCIYGRPLHLPGASHVLLRKQGKWTVAELAAVIPALAK